MPARLYPAAGSEVITSGMTQGNRWLVIAGAALVGLVAGIVLLSALTPSAPGRERPIRLSPSQEAAQSGGGARNRDDTRDDRDDNDRDGARDDGVRERHDGGPEGDDDVREGDDDGAREWGDGARDDDGEDGGEAEDDDGGGDD